MDALPYLMDKVLGQHAVDLLVALLFLILGLTFDGVLLLRNQVLRRQPRHLALVALAGVLDREDQRRLVKLHQLVDNLASLDHRVGHRHPDKRVSDTLHLAEVILGSLRLEYVVAALAPSLWRME